MRGGVGFGGGFGEVAGAGADVEAATASLPRAGFDVDLPVAALAGWIGGAVGNGVLAADVFGDLGGERVDILERAGEVGDTAGLLSDFFEDFLGVADFVLVGVVAE